MGHALSMPVQKVPQYWRDASIMQGQRQHGSEKPPHLDESVLAAMALYEAYGPPKVLDYCNSARSVIEGGLPDDPPFCMRTSVSQSVPGVVGTESETGLLVIERIH